MRQLEHPNIINLIDFSESKQYYYIILELAPGGELFHQIVRLTYFSEDLSRHVIVQVARALEYLHEVRGVVHRSVTIAVLYPSIPHLRPPTCVSLSFTAGSSPSISFLMSTLLCVVLMSLMRTRQFQCVRPLTSYHRSRLQYTLRAPDAAVQR